MSKAFFLTSLRDNIITLDQLHVNLWFFSYHKIIFEIGLLTDIDKQFFFSGELIDLRCYSPFTIKHNTLCDLYDKLCNEDTIQLLFNDRIESVINCSTLVGEAPNARFVRFRSKRKFLMLRPSYIQPDGNSNKIEITFNSRMLDVDVLNKQFSNEETIRTYSRFRYEIDVKRTSNIYRNRRVIHDQILFDFRFNEPRLFEISESNLNELFIQIRSIFIFTIQPIYFTILLEPGGNRRYVRLFEKEKDGWEIYLEYIKKQRDIYLVYHWLVNFMSEKSIQESNFNMLLLFKAEKSNISKQLNISLLIGLISSLFILIPHYINISHIAGRLTSYIQAIGGIGLALGGGIATHAIYDYLKEIFKDKWKRYKKS